MKHFCDMTLEELINPNGYDCSCGKHHQVDMKYLKIGRDAVNYLPEAMEKVGVSYPFIVCDQNTRKAAWDKVKAVLDANGIKYKLFCFEAGHVTPNEYAMGSLIMAFDTACDCVIGIGSGVINDCCKILAHTSGRPQMIIGTAPSMDGYASNSSCMIIGGVKISLYNACPKVIIADTMIMKDAPERMLWAGFGDMIAKYIALCEWRISNMVTGEFYCEEIAMMMRASLRKIMAGAQTLMDRDPEAIGSIVEGLILSGFAMTYASISRPASGLEHYFSHLWEMMGLQRGLPEELHGIQVGVGSYLTFKILDKLRNVKPDRALAEKAMAEFDNANWESEMHRIFDTVADSLIVKEHELWHKNDPEHQAQRLTNIINNWDKILQAMDEELPVTEEIIAVMNKLGMPVHPADIDENEQDTRDAFIHSRDIRDKYLTSSLLWDIGRLYDFPLEM